MIRVNYKIYEVRGLKEDIFRAYLNEVFDNDRVVSDCISRCRRVNKYEGDLDSHYNNDRGRALLDKLTYSKTDAEQCKNPKHSISIKGSKGYYSIYEGTNSLFSAVKRYFDFLSTKNQ